jgi:hypothetical protein
MGVVNNYSSCGVLGQKRKREDSGDIPRPFMRGGGEPQWSGAATGANAIGVKKVESL